MASLEYFLLSESFSVDAQTNRVSLFNVIEEITTAQFPVALPSMTAVSCWRMNQDEIGEDYQVVLVIVSPSGEEHSRHPFNFTASNPRQRLLSVMEGFVFSERGDWRFSVELNGNHGASHTVSAREANPLS